MGIVRGQSLMIGAVGRSISSKSGIILTVDINMTGRTLIDPTNPDSGYAQSNMWFHAVDQAGRYPLGGDTANPIEIPFLGNFFYRNDSSDIYRDVDNLGLGSIKLTTAITRIATFTGNLTFATQLVDVARPHNINVSWEIYEFD